MTLLRKSIVGLRISDALDSGINAFGFVRLVLALAVVYSHAFSIPVGSVLVEPLRASTGFTLGEHAVNGFFAISGFLVAMSFDRRGLRDYVLARALRIGPGLVGATLTCALIMGPLLTTFSVGDYFRHPKTFGFVWQVLTGLKSANSLPGVFDTNPFFYVMGTVWTLKYEVLCYAALALAGAAGLLRKPLLATLAVIGIAVGLLAYNALHPGLHNPVTTSLRLSLLFSFGSLMYVLRERVRLIWPLVFFMAAVVLLVRSSFAYDTALLLTEAYGVLTFAMGAGTRRLPGPSFDLSYGVYLYGWPIQQALYALHPTKSVIALLAPALVITVAVAFASWTFIEKPALRLKERWAGLSKRMV